MAKQIFESVRGILEAADAEEGGKASRRRSDGCLAARAAMADVRRERKRWGNLMLFVGLAVALTLTYLLLQLTDLDAPIDKVKAAGGAAGALLTGGMAAWLRRQLNASKKEFEDWVELVNRRCP